MKQLPHAIGNGTTTRSPFFRFFTPRPTSTTSPMNSCPSMSPLSIVGTKPLYRWRSDPQMAVDVIFTIASLWLRILGSGTVSTLTFSLPIQQFALIGFPFLRLLYGCGSSHAFRRPYVLLRWTRGMLTAMDARVRLRYFTDFEQLLEVMQRNLHMLLWNKSEKSTQRCTQTYGADLDTHFCSAIARRGLEP